MQLRFACDSLELVVVWLFMFIWWHSNAFRQMVLVISWLHACAHARILHFPLTLTHPIQMQSKLIFYLLWSNRLSFVTVNYNSQLVSAICVRFQRNLSCKIEYSLHRARIRWIVENSDFTNRSDDGLSLNDLAAQMDLTEWTKSDCNIDLKWSQQQKRQHIHQKMYLSQFRAKFLA